MKPAPLNTLNMQYCSITYSMCLESFTKKHALHALHKSYILSSTMSLESLKGEVKPELLGNLSSWPFLCFCVSSLQTRAQRLEKANLFFEPLQWSESWTRQPSKAYFSHLILWCPIITCNLFIYFPRLDNASSLSQQNRISHRIRRCLQAVTPLHSSAGLFWRAFGLADHWSEISSKSQDGIGTMCHSGFSIMTGIIP